MSKIEDIMRKIGDLVKQGYDLAALLRDDSDSDKYMQFLSGYEVWYTQSLSLIERFVPGRKDDFVRLYKDCNREAITPATYTISDALAGIHLSKGGMLNEIDIVNPATACTLVFRQAQMLQASLVLLNDELYCIEDVLQADLFDSDIEASKHLLEKGHVRAAGAVCGVVLEKHLGALCKKYNIVIERKKPCASDYNNELKKHNVINETQRSCCAMLISIRNMCDHPNEPSRSDVQTLIAGTEEIINTDI